MKLVIRDEQQNNTENDVSSEESNWVVWLVQGGEYILLPRGGVGGLLVHHIGRSSELIPSLFLIPFLITRL